MDITIVTGVGTGPTNLAAFDTALIDAGVHNHNLIYLSSVIPPSSHIEYSSTAKFISVSDDFGKRMYVVCSQQRTEIIGQTAVASIGWVQNPVTGRGLFVEIHGYSKRIVESDVHSTLATMVGNRGQEVYSEVKKLTASIRCEHDPVCALVVAVYKVEDW